MKQRRQKLLGRYSEQDFFNKLIGHSDLEATTVYLHLSRRHLQATTNPLERISISDPAQLERSRRKRKPE